MCTIHRVWPRHLHCQKRSPVINCTLLAQNVKKCRARQSIGNSCTNWTWPNVKSNSFNSSKWTRRQVHIRYHLRRTSLANSSRCRSTSVKASVGQYPTEPWMNHLLKLHLSHHSRQYNATALTTLKNQVNWNEETMLLVVTTAVPRRAVFLLLKLKLFFNFPPTLSLFASSHPLPCQCGWCLIHCEIQTHTERFADAEHIVKKSMRSVVLCVCSPFFVCAFSLHTFARICTHMYDTNSGMRDRKQRLRHLTFKHQLIGCAFVRFLSATVMLCFRKHLHTNTMHTHNERKRKSVRLSCNSERSAALGFFLWNYIARMYICITKEGESVQ